MPADLMSADTDPAAGHSLLATLRTFLHSFPSPGLLLVAYSGGSDSTALLLGLVRVVDEPAFAGFSLNACTVDHQLRQGSGAEAQAAAELCARHGIPHSIATWHGEKPSTGLQQAARDARYRLLVSKARQCRAIAIVTGHTMNDQGETIAMRAHRGAGPGLSGMPSAVLCHAEAWVLRPLLGLSRAALRTSLTAWGETWIDDPSNENPRFERVRLRQGGLSPAGEGDAGADDGGAQRLASSRRQAAWLDAHVTVWNGAVSHVSPSGLETLHDEAALALFALSAAIGGKSFPVGRDSRQRITDWLATGAPGRMTAGGTVFDRRSQGLYLYREARGLTRQTMTAAGEVYDGRYRLLPGHLLAKAGTPIELGPARDPEAVAAWLVAAGVPAAIARRAAPAVPDAAVRRDGLQRIIAGQDRFLPAFDLPHACVMARLFAVPQPPPLPVRQ